MNEEEEIPTKNTADEGRGAQPSSRLSQSQTHEAEGSASQTQDQGEDTLDLTGTGPPPPEPKLADVEIRRDSVRLVVTIGLLLILAFVVVWSCIETSSWQDHWEHTKEMLQIILPALTGLIGSVIGFYFGAGGRSGGMSSG